MIIIEEANNNYMYRNWIPVSESGKAICRVDGADDSAYTYNDWVYDLANDA